MKTSNFDVQLLLAGMEAIGQPVECLEAEISNDDLIDLIEHFAKEVKAGPSHTTVNKAMQINHGLKAAQRLQTEIMNSFDAKLVEMTEGLVVN